MEAGRKLLAALMGATVFAMSCASPPATPAPAAAKPDSPPSPAVAAPAPAAPAAPAPAAPAPAAPAAPAPAAPAPAFVASEELYRATFREVQEVIAAISRTIAADDYEGWVSYLTEEYVRTRSSEAFLADASHAAVLKKNGIVLKNLRDYFDNVVVRSRLQATLDDIQFEDETHVKAVALVQGTPVILYYLVREDGKWKVGLKAAGDG